MRAGELVDHVAFGDVDLGDLDREAQLLGHERHRHRAEADLADEGMVVAVAALGRIAERQQEALVAARQVLQPHRPRRGQGERRAGRSSCCRCAGPFPRGGGSSMPSRSRMSPTRGRCLGRIDRRRRRGRTLAVGHQREVEQAVGVVEGRAQHLAARHILEGGGDAPLGHHAAGVDRQGVAEARQGGAVGAQQEDRLDQVAARLLDGERGQLAVVARALGHHAIDGERELLVDLLERELRHVAVAAPPVGQQLERVVDGRLAALDCHIHVRPPRRCCAAAPGDRRRR